MLTTAANLRQLCCGSCSSWQSRKMDQDDKRAVEQIANWITLGAFLLVGATVVVLFGAVALGVSVRLFMWVSGL